MIVLILAVALILLFLHYKLSPRKYLVHCSRAQNFPDSRRPDFKDPRPKLFFTSPNTRLPRKNRFIGEALGPSMEPHGIQNGSEFFGEFIAEETTRQERFELIKPEQIVVVDDIARYSKTGKRLRKVVDVGDDGMVTFYPDHLGASHQSRDISKVSAIVTHLGV